MTNSICLSSFVCELKRKSKIIVIGLFSIIIIIGCIRIPTYGVSWDEDLEIFTLQSNMKSYSDFFNKSGSENENYFNVQTPIKQNVERDHGSAIYYPTAISALIFDDFHGRGALLIRHYYTFAVFVLSLFFLYSLVKSITKRRLYGIITVLFMVISPRIFIESFYNCKDIMLMSLVSIGMFASYKFISTKELKWGIIFGIVSAFAANLRIIGFFMFAIFGLLYLIDFFKELIKCKKINKNDLLSGICCIAAFIVVYFLITPACWGDIIEYFDYLINQSMDFSRWDNYILFNNDLYINSSNPLPWYYIPEFILITTPVVITILSFVGLIIVIIKSFNKKVLDTNMKYYLIFLLFALIPLITAIVKKSNIYNGWRHFYFIYPVVIILAVVGLKRILESKGIVLKRITKGIIAVDIIAVIVISCINPFTMQSYFNPLVYITGKADSFEHDYWNVACTQCMIELSDNCSDDKINITAYDWATQDGLKKAYNFLPEKYQERFNVFSPDSVDGVDELYIMQNTTYANLYSKESSEGISNNQGIPFRNGVEIAKINSFDYPVIKIYEINKK